MGLVAISRQSPQPPIIRSWPVRLGVDINDPEYRIDEQFSLEHPPPCLNSIQLGKGSDVHTIGDENPVFPQRNDFSVYVIQRERTLGKKIIHPSTVARIKKAFDKEKLNKDTFRNKIGYQCDNLIEKVSNDHSKRISICDLWRYLHDHLDISLEKIDEIAKARKNRLRRDTEAAKAAEEGETVSYNYLHVKLPKDKAQDIEKGLKKAGVYAKFSNEDIESSAKAVEEIVRRYIYDENMVPLPKRVRLLNRYMAQKWGITLRNIKTLDMIRADELKMTVNQLCGSKSSRTWKQIYKDLATASNGASQNRVDESTGLGHDFGPQMMYSSEGEHQEHYQYTHTGVYVPWNEGPSMGTASSDSNDQRQNHENQQPYGQSFGSSAQYSPYNAQSWVPESSTLPIFTDQHDFLLHYPYSPNYAALSALLSSGSGYIQDCTQDWPHPFIPQASVTSGSQYYPYSGPLH